MKEQNYMEEDEITLKELILKIKEFFQEVVKNWFLVLSITLLIVLYFFLKTYSAPVTYTSELTFMMNDNESSASGGLGGLAATFGIGGGAGSDFNLEKMMTLLHSRNIIQQGLFEKAEINGNGNYFANHLIQEYDFHDEWKEIESLKGFLFKNDNVKEFTRLENKILKILHDLVSKEILSSNIADNTGIMTLNIESTNEDLSIEFLNALYEKLTSFYVNKAIEKQLQTYKITKSTVDSLSGVMDYAQKRLLKIKDSNRNITLNQYKLEQLNLERDFQVTLLAYGEALKHKEIAEFSLKSKTPFIQLIDRPIPPLPPNKSIITYIKQIIIGGILGVFLAIAFIIGRKIYRDTMESD